VFPVLKTGSSSGCPGSSATARKPVSATPRRQTRQEDGLFPVPHSIHSTNRAMEKSVRRKACRGHRFPTGHTMKYAISNQSTR